MLLDAALASCSLASRTFYAWPLIRMTLHAHAPSLRKRGLTLLAASNLAAGTGPGVGGGGPLGEAREPVGELDTLETSMRRLHRMLGTVVTFVDDVVVSSRGCCRRSRAMPVVAWRIVFFIATSIVPFSFWGNCSITSLAPLHSSEP